MKELLSWDQTLFKDSELFELDHIPEHFLHRIHNFHPSCIASGLPWAEGGL